MSAEMEVELSRTNSEFQVSPNAISKDKLIMKLNGYSKVMLPLEATLLSVLNPLIRICCFMEPCFYQGGNERVSGSMACDMAKHSSQNSTSSLPISSPIQGQKPTFAKDVQNKGCLYTPELYKIHQVSHSFFSFKQPR